MIELVLFFILCAGLVFFIVLEYKKNHQKKIEEKRLINFTLTPKGTIILFDLHDVVFESDWPKVFTLLNKRKDKWWILIRFIRPVLLFYAAVLFYTQGSWNEFVHLLKKRFPHLMQYIPLIKEILNQQKPIEQTIAIIKDLKKEGYRIDVASNIGSPFLIHLESTFPEIFANFDYVKIISGDGDSLLKKPNLEFFRTYIATFNSDGKHIVFIDNFLPSVKAAQKLGIIGIHFQDPKQLKNQLIQLGILPKN